MIRSFRCRETERIFNRQRSPKLPQQIQRVTLRKLRMIDAATTLIDLQIPPANRLEKLGCDRKGTYSIRINDQYRLCFKWRDGDAYEVEVVDYH